MMRSGIIKVRLLNIAILVVVTVSGCQREASDLVQHKQSALNADALSIAQVNTAPASDLAAEKSASTPNFVLPAERRFSRAGQLFFSARLPPGQAIQKRVSLQVDGQRHAVAVASPEGDAIFVRMVGQRMPKRTEIRWSLNGDAPEQRLHVVSVSLADEAPDVESRFYEAAAHYFSTDPTPSVLTEFTAGRLSLLAGGVVSDSRWTYPGVDGVSPAGTHKLPLVSLSWLGEQRLQRSRGAGHKPRPKQDVVLNWSTLSPIQGPVYDYPKTDPSSFNPVTTLSRYLPDDVAVLEGRSLTGLTDLFGPWFAPNINVLNPLRYGWTPGLIMRRFVDELMMSMLYETEGAKSSLNPVSYTHLTLPTTPYV